MRSSETPSTPPPAIHRTPRATRRVIPGLPTGRIKEGRRLQAFRADLIRHVGGAPTKVQAVLIDRATMLQCHVSRMDIQALVAGGMSDHASRQYLAWSNTLTRTLARLGLDAAPPPPPRQLTPRQIMRLDPIPEEHTR
jgi:hypothetical protein